MMVSYALQKTESWRFLWRQFLTVFAALMGTYVLFRLSISPGQSPQPLNLTLYASLVTSMVGLVAIRGLSRYPGAEAVASVLPVFTIAYAVLMAGLLFGRVDYSRGMLFGGYMMCCVALFAQHLVLPNRRRLRIGVIATGSSAQNLPAGNIEWVDIMSPDAPLGEVDAVTVDLRVDLPDAWERRITEMALENVPVYHIKHLRESLSGRVELEHMSETSFGTLSPPLVYVAVKRVIDVAVALVCLLLLLPLLVTVAAVVKLDSPGPSIFRQRRIGFRGKPFTVCKFRTMRVAVEGEDSRYAAMTQEGDVRITRVGRFLRKSRLDELPQLVNILRGEMSLIGPRPEAEILSKWYEQEIPFYRYRHIIKPGVTGWAQVSQGHVTEVKDVTDKLHYDFYYIKNLSPWIDFVILMRTILTMVSGSGAK